MAAKSTRKSLSFDDSATDRALLAAIAAEQEQRGCGFSDVCKQILSQMLLKTTPMTELGPSTAELQLQLSQLAARVEALEQRRLPEGAQPEAKADVSPVENPPVDPVIARLSSLVEDF